MEKIEKIPKKYLSLENDWVLNKFIIRTSFGIKYELYLSYSN